ncbi:M14 family metallopeptidase [Actinokineospora inagensis]|uniref:M14 family metallopeptidase n=1 Tax=Actinokineospora inagensis TaxID=103730 RepID=UPI00040C6D5A|nr:M14 family metallopeptidase [Actinokineospora inagensis]
MVKRYSLIAAVAAAAVVLTTNGVASGAPHPGSMGEVGGTTSGEQRASADYSVSGVRTAAQRNAVAATGAAVNGTEDQRLLITATPAEVVRIRALGLTVVAEAPPPSDRGSTGAQDFPGSDANYHNFAEMNAEIDRAIAAHPGIITKRVIGKSYQGRDILAVKISDNAATDENEPEVLFTAHQHAREHITVEMALYLINLLTGGYNTDSHIKALVDSREIWVLPDLNPDGGEYDISTGSYKSWRKNRQPNAGSSYVGTDLNRNWDFKWGCCGGSSTSPSSETYRGASAGSAPEVSTVQNFVKSRAVGGKQQISTAIDFHSYGELVMWPFGWTQQQVVTGMTRDEYNTFQTIGKAMARTNSYTAEQDSALYITDGAIDDYLWGAHKIWAFTFEMYPTGSSGGGFYPPDEIIDRETTRNKAAVLYLLDYSDCPPRTIGKTC